MTTLGLLLPAAGYIMDYLKKPREFKAGIKAIGWVLLLMLAVYFTVRLCFTLLMPEQ